MIRFSGINKTGSALKCHTRAGALWGRHLWFGAWFAGTSILVHEELAKLGALAWSSRQYSHIVLVPLVSIYLIWQRRNEVFSPWHKPTYSGLWLLLAGVGLLCYGRYAEYRLSENDYLSVTMLAFVSFCVSGVTVCYGRETLRKVACPLGLLLFMIPIPTLVADGIVYALRVGSTAAADTILRMLGVNAEKNGFCLFLPGLGVEVAPQCSGINSAIGLLIGSVLVGYFWLQTWLARTSLVVLGVVISVLKNGLRIVGITLLTVYAGDEVWTDTLHSSAGIPFFVAALAVLLLSARALRGVERRAARDTGNRSKRAGVREDER